MKRTLIWFIVFGILTSLTAYGQLKVNPNGRFFNYKGTQIYYEETGSGEPLLLLHNFFGTADHWKPYVETYARHFRTIAIDMMGHGRSDIYQKGIRHADYAEIILALLDSLKLHKVNGIGASSGGMTLLYLNTKQPERFKSVIAIGGQIYYSRQCREWITQKGQDNFMNAAIAWKNSPEKAALLVKQFWQFRELYGDPSFTPDMLNNIKANWLVVQGDNDEPVPLQQAIDMHQYIPDSRLWIVPNGGHLPHLIPDFQPEFLKVSLEFLTGKWDKKD